MWIGHVVIRHVNRTCESDMLWSDMWIRHVVIRHVNQTCRSTVDQTYSRLHQKSKRTVGTRERALVILNQIKSIGYFKSNQINWLIQIKSNQTNRLNRIKSTEVLSWAPTAHCKKHRSSLTSTSGSVPAMTPNNATLQSAMQLPATQFLTRPVSNGFDCAISSL